MTENKALALHLADALDYNEFDVVEDSQRTAAELRRLYQENEEDQGVIAVWRGRTQRAEAQRDQLLEALKSTGLFLHHCWCDVQMNDYSFEKLNQQMAVVDAAIKKAEEGK